MEGKGWLTSVVKPPEALRRLRRRGAFSASKRKGTVVVVCGLVPEKVTVEEHRISGMYYLYVLKYDPTHVKNVYFLKHIQKK